jgi:hypothetical protein
MLVKIKTWDLVHLAVTCCDPESNDHAYFSIIKCDFFLGNKIFSKHNSGPCMLLMNSEIYYAFFNVFN